MTIQNFTRPSNKHVKRWPVVRASLDGYSLTRYSDGGLHFFHENSIGYAMITRKNQVIYNTLKLAII